MTSRVTVVSWLATFPRRWVLHDLTDAQRVERVRLLRSLFESLRLRQDTEFKRLATGNESWVYHIYRCHETYRYASSREEVPPMVRNTKGTSNVMITAFPRDEGLIGVGTLDRMKHRLSHRRLYNRPRTSGRRSRDQAIGSSPNPFPGSSPGPSPTRLNSSINVAGGVKLHHMATCDTIISQQLRLVEKP
jgi:hypothetical protein